jgi:cell division protein FtsW
MPAATSASNVVRVRRIPAETILLVAVIVLVIAGVLIVFDASFPLSLESKKVGYDPLYFGKQQSKGLIVGLLGMFTAMNFKYKKLRAFSYPLVVVGLVLLMMVWFPHIGVVKLHGRRWVNLGLVFQPSEIAKLTLILFLAVRLSEGTYGTKRVTNRVSSALAVTGVYLMLILMEPDLGTTIVLFMAFFTMFCVAGAKARQILVILALVPILLALKGGLKPGQKTRLNVFLQQGENASGDGYQSYHSKLAIGSGQYTGVGWGSGREKYYLPQANSDYIFATVGEEFGLIGTWAMMLAFAVVTWCGIVISRQAPDQFGRLLAGGLTALISWQALINIAVVTVSIPATGVPLPFISNGITSLVLTLISIGVLVNIGQASMGVRIGPAGEVAQ